MSLDHEAIRELLLEDIAINADLAQRRAAVETYALMVQTIIQFDQAYEDIPDPIMSDDEIDRLYIVECSR